MAAGMTLAILAPIGVYEIYAHHFGATVDDIAKVDLAQPMSAVERQLPATHEHGSRIETRFRHAVPGFESAQIRFDDEVHCAYSIELERVHEKPHGDKKEGAEVTLAQKLERVLPGVDANGEWSWGAVTFRASESELMFKVKPDASNPAFHVMVDAARQVLLAVAFDRPTPSPIADLQATLGVGYPLSAVSAIDWTQDFTSHESELRTRFPSGTSRSGSLDIPVDHPAVRSVMLEWGRGRLDRLRIKPRTTNAAPTFGACASTKLPASARTRDDHEIRVDVAKSSTADLAATLAAIDACR